VIGRAAAWLLLAASAGDAAACSCRMAPIEERLDEADTIALVRVHRIELDRDWSGRPGATFASGFPLRAEADVLETLRGAPRATLQLRTGFGGGDCGVPLTPGDDVLLIASGTDGEFELHFCSASRVLGRGSLLEAMGLPAPRSRERLYLQAVREYLAAGTPIHACLQGGVPPPPPPPPAPDAEPVEMPVDCRTWVREQSEAPRR
jgi:hypothetical protein